MKKIVPFIGFVALIFISSLGLARHFWRGETLSVEKVALKWGEKPFSEEKFKSATEQERAEMAASLLKKQSLFKGKDPNDIRREFGDPDGFYFSDLFPAYIIHSANKPGEIAWQIVFLLDSKEKVSEVIVHRNN